LAISVTDNGANLEFDCAHGQFDTPLRPDARGRFVVPGTYVREHGGPVRKDEVPNPLAVQYTGMIQGIQMTIAVRLLGASRQIGAFVVTQGQPAQLVKCK